MPDPGWYDDPKDQTQFRWWDGSRWTERRQPRTTAMPPPPPASASYGIPLGEGGGSAGGAAPTPEDPWADVPSTGGGGAWSAGGGFGAGTAGASGLESGWGATPSAGFATVGTGAAPPRTFGEAIKVCLTKYVDGKGRASRSEYWYFALFQFLADILTGGIAAIFLLLPSITVSVRRLHDIGKTAWSLLRVLVPLLGWAILLYYTVKPGEPGLNAYG